MGRNVARTAKGVEERLGKYQGWLAKLAREHDGGFHISPDGVQEAIAWAVSIGEAYLTELRKGMK